MKKLLIVDDDLLLAAELRDSLSALDMHIDTVANGSDGLRAVKQATFDFILLDWNLPDMTGLDVCVKIRASGCQTPIVFLTARNDLDDKESGLDAGGDDYVTKPFELRELLARLRTIERRTVRFNQDAFSIGDIVFKPRLRLVHRGSQRVRLSGIESAILELLMQNRDRFLSSQDVLTALWQSDSTTTEAVVRNHIKFLRRKLKEIQSDDLIETVAGAGYIIKSQDA